ncbi:MAG: DUF4340 domain-containing protein, partial [Verrucomicrobiota bacterium]|nr:DUF4340 domain-containing protein [Verrucomicrobiota bacterium]
KEEGDNGDIYTISDKLLTIIPTSPDHLRDRVLFPGEAAGVRRVEIRGPAGFVQLVKDPQTGWHIRQPVAAPADPKEVEGFIEKLYRLHIKDFVADNVSDFSIYGLQGEIRQISLGGGDGTSRMLVVGDDVPGHPGFVYVRRADDTSVFELDADVLQLLNMPAQRFRDAKVLDLPLGDITSVSVTRGSEELRMELDPSKGWKTTSPVVWDADGVAVTQLAKTWTDAVVIEFDVATNITVGGEWGLEFGSTLSGTTNRLEILPAGGKKDGLFIRRDGDAEWCQINLAEVPDSVIDPLTYKDSKVWTLAKEGINKVAVLKPGQPRQVVERQQDRSFALAETNGNVRVDTDAFDKLLNQIIQIEASGYITYNPRDLEIYGLANPLLELHIGLSTTNELGRVLLVGRQTAEGYYSMVKGRDVVFYLEKPVVQVLSANLVAEQRPTVSISE